MIVEDQSEVIEFLSSSAAHETDAHVRRIDTHGAIVFLAGPSALKLKRAVYFDYMDYSTVTKRRAACEAEIRINRRTAPTIYRDVRAIRRGPDGRLGWGKTGEIVDWVVRMARFDENQVFDELAQRHELTDELIDGLADAVAAFHEAAEPSPSYGGVDGIAEVVDENSAELARYPDIFDSVSVAQLTTSARANLRAYSERLERRRENGLVRHCHGDLHLRNVCMVEGRPTLFDAIEFSESFACIDVFYDIAFLIMDLWHRGLRHEANRVLNRYLWWRDDLDGLGPLPLFLSCRAGIRAHVDAAAMTGGTEQSEVDQLREEAAAYLKLSREVLERGIPHLVAIGGLSGSGKSTVARLLAPQLGRIPGALLLQSDVIRKRLFEVAPEAHLPRDAYSTEASARVYTQLRSRAQSALADGCSVIVDAVHARPQERDAVAQLAKAANIPFVGFWLDVAKETLVERVSQRERDVSDATAAVVEKQTGYNIGEVDWCRIDAASDPQSMCEQITLRIADGNAGQASAA